MPPPQAAAATVESETPKRVALARTVAVDVLACPRCQGRMKLLALVKDPASIAAAGEVTEVPRRSPGRGPPDGKSSK